MRPHSGIRGDTQKWGEMKNYLGAAALTAAVALVGCTPSNPGTTTTVPTGPTADRFVVNGAADVGDCATLATACGTVNYAVSQAADGETISVGAGTYDEMVSVDKSLTFEGPNAGIGAGTAAGTRGAEATVKGFRSPGNPHPVAAYEFDVTIDGFSIDPQGDSSLLTPDTLNLIALYGGSDVEIVNNRLNGGTWNPLCSYSCTTMADSAILVRSGSYLVSNNRVENFRRPLDISQASPATPVVSAKYTKNVVQNFSFRGFWAAEWDNSAFGANTISIDDNYIEGGSTADLTANPTFSPTAMLVTAGGVNFTNNTVKNVDTGIYEEVCGVPNPNDLVNRYTGNTFDELRAGLTIATAGDCTGRTADRVFTGNSFVGGVWDRTGNPTRAAAWFVNGVIPADASGAPGTVDAACTFWGSADGPGVNPNPWVTPGVSTTPFRAALGDACP